MKAEELPTGLRDVLTKAFGPLEGHTIERVRSDRDTGDRFYDVERGRVVLVDDHVLALLEPQPTWQDALAEAMANAERAMQRRIDRGPLP